MVGPDHPRWVGGRIRSKTGYWLLWRPDHPNANSRGYVAEHRAVMADLLGRPLRKTEHVHHVNGKRGDNRPENLVLLSNAEHAAGHQAEVRALERWSRKHAACADCGTTEHRHFGGGLCVRCYQRTRGRALRAAGYIAPSRRKPYDDHV